MTLDLARPLHARRAAEALAGFDPRDLGEHQVAVGESLAQIAGLWYGPLRIGLFTLIVKRNSLIGTTIQIGQRLIIPRAGWKLL